MPIAEDLAAIARQEAELHFSSFDYDTAWRLGQSLRELALSRNQSLVIDIRRFGQPHQPHFYTALAGTTPDNPRWVQRKSNVVASRHRRAIINECAGMLPGTIELNFRLRIWIKIN